MQVISVMDNLNVLPRLQSLKFMRGLAAAKGFLLQLKSIKDNQILDKKPQNSLAFSPIAQNSSIASDPNTHRQIEKGSIITVRQSRAEGQYDNKWNNNQLGNNYQGSRQSNLDYLKNQINMEAKLLNEMHSQLVFTEKAIEVLSEKLLYNCDTFRKIQNLKHQERNKNIELMTIKTSVAKKKLLLQELSKNKDKFQLIFKTAVKNHFIDQNQNFGIEPVLHFAKQIVVKKIQQPQQIQTDGYPQKLELKFKTIKKKQKERKKEDIFTEQYIKEKDLDKQKEEKKRMGVNQFDKLGIDSDTYYDSQFIDS